MKKSNLRQVEDCISNSCFNNCPSCSIGNDKYRDMQM